MITFELAKKLDRAGLEWLPRDGDQFMIPGHNLDGQVFSMSSMTVDTRDEVGGRVITFNGTVEWALDSVLEEDVLWLPSESQLRDRLGSTFRALEAVEDGYRCTVLVGNDSQLFEGATPADAYGEALLELLERPADMLKAIVAD